MRFLMLYVFPALTLVIGIYLPGAIQITILVATMLGAGQALLFRSPRVRRMLNMTPIIRPQSAQQAAALQPRITITPPNVKQGVEEVVNPMQRYQPPKKSVIGGMTDSWRSYTAGISRRVWDMTGGRYGTGDAASAAQKQSARVHKSFKREAEVYEKRRSAELMDEKWVKARQREELQSERQQAKQRRSASN
jgi:hypothetical protein